MMMLFQLHLQRKNDKVNKKIELVRYAWICSSKGNCCIIDWYRSKETKKKPSHHLMNVYNLLKEIKKR